MKLFFVFLFFSSLIYSDILIFNNPVYREEHENIGITAFDIYENEVYLLHNEGFVIKGQEKIKLLEKYIEHFCVTQDGIIYINPSNMLVIGENKYNIPVKFIKDIRNINGEIWVTDHRGWSWNHKNNSYILGFPSIDGNFYSTKKVSNKLGLILNHTSGYAVECEFPEDQDLLSLDFIGIMNNFYYIVCEFNENNYIRRKVLKVDNTGNFEEIFTLPSQFLYITRDIILKNNKVYCLFTTKNDIKIYSNEDFEILNLINSSTIKYNNIEDHVNTRDPVEITRDQVMITAESYEIHSWNAQSDNITGGLIQDPMGVWIRTPSWVIVGSHTKIPYKWGGFSTITGFDNGLSSSLYAGDNYTSKPYGSSYCVGVDCSGFVSRCWGLSSHHGTGLLPNVSTLLSSYEDLQRGDILLKSGHVRLCAEDNPSGLVNTIEASGVDWRVSYRTYTFSSLSSNGYDPRYYNNIENTYNPSFVVTPTITLNVREGPSVSYNVFTTISTDQEFVSNNYTTDWYRIFIPSGTGYSYGWCYGGDGLSTGYLTGAPYSAKIRVKSFKGTLNVREGPSTSYPVITTITTNQEFAVLDSQSQWYNIYLPANTNHTDGWCSAGGSGQYLEIIYPDDDTLGYYDGEIVFLDYPSTMQVNELDSCYIEVKNTGNYIYDSFVYIGTTEPRDRNSDFYYNTWIENNRAAKPTSYALPNQKTYFKFNIQAPLVTALYYEYFSLVKGISRWFSDEGEITDTSILLNILVQNGASVEENLFTFVFPEVINNNFQFALNLTKPSFVVIKIYDISGRNIKNLVNREYVQGSHSINYSFTDNNNNKINNGIYFIRLQINDDNRIYKLNYLE